ncbi:MAG: MFS transporter [Gammaproteobacteria bacterium]|jgi:PAT family beta-lactamase induction signal transducer AmpG|nr:MFS transporter [Gammaproteobacteria bacterium]
MSSSTPSLTLRQAIALFQDKRLLWIFLLGFSSGFPWVLIGSAMSAWLQEAGLTRTAIGFFGSVFIVYAINFLWAPLLDRLKVPLLGNRLGQRRSWIVLMQWIIAGAALAIGMTNPDVSIFWTSLLALLIATASATQDIAVDAYRIEIIGATETEKIPHAAAITTSGWWTGFSVPGAMALYLSDIPGVDWSTVYAMLAVLMLLLSWRVWKMPEPETLREQAQHEAEAHYEEELDEHHLASSGESRHWMAWWAVTVVEPFAEFFRRNGWKLAIAVLSFIFLFKLGEAFLGRMSIVFYKEIGFSNSEIATYSKLIGWWVTIIFSLLAGVFNARFGIVRGLMIGGIAMASTNLLFAWLALAGPNTNIFALAVVLDNFTSSFATVTFVTFISYLTSRAYTATQYALMASLGNLGRTTVASFSGVVVDGLDGDWFIFFLLTSLMVVPALLLLWRIGHHLHTEKIQDRHS